MSDINNFENNNTEQNNNHTHSHHHSHSHSSESGHHHSSHSHSSHSSHKHSSRGSHAKSKDKKKKKFEISRKALISWVAILTVAVMFLGVWNVFLSIRLNSSIDRLSALIEKNASGTVQPQAPEQDKIPDYVKAEADRVIQQVKAVQSEDTVSFFAVSDMHVDITDEDMVNALGHAGMAMGLIKKEVDIDFAANLGDITEGSVKTTVKTAETEIQKAYELVAPGFSDIPNFVSVGNHDLLVYSYDQNKDYLDSKELYNLIGKNNVDAVFQKGEEDRNYCYRDFEDSKLRVINLNTNDIKNVTDESIFKDENNYCRMSPEQVTWLADTLKMSDKADAENWKILLISHIPLYTVGYEYVADLIDGYNNGASGSVSVKGVNVAYDFSGSNKAKLVANVHGHLHNYRSDVIGASKLSAVSVPNACYGRNNTKADSESEEFRNRYGEKITYNKTYGTKDDTAFCVITIDFRYNRIYATCYGAGYDREISF